MTDQTPEFTLRDLQAIEARARVLRARAFATAFRGIGRAVVRALHWIAHPLPSRVS